MYLMAPRTISQLFERHDGLVLSGRSMEGSDWSATMRWSQTVLALLEYEDVTRVAEVECPRRDTDFLAVAHEPQDSKQLDACVPLCNSSAMDWTYVLASSSPSISSLPSAFCASTSAAWCSSSALRASASLGSPLSSSPSRRWNVRRPHRHDADTVAKIITKDNVSIDIAAVAYYHVTDPAKSVIAIEDVYQATNQISQNDREELVGQFSSTNSLRRLQR